MTVKVPDYRPALMVAFVCLAAVAVAAFVATIHDKTTAQDVNIQSLWVKVGTNNYWAFDVPLKQQ